MSDRVALTDGPETADNGPAPGEPMVAGTVSLEQRVRRLEDAVAQLQDTRLVEEHVLERLAARLPPPPPPEPTPVPLPAPAPAPASAPAAAPDPAAMIINAGRHLLPV